MCIKQKIALYQSLKITSQPQINFFFKVLNDIRQLVISMNLSKMVSANLYPKVPCTKKTHKI